MRLTSQFVAQRAAKRKPKRTFFMCCADGNERESEQPQLIVLIAVSVCDMGVSAVAVCTLYLELDTPKNTPRAPSLKNLGATESNAYVRDVWVPRS